mmetsp:Transcript_47710/g.54944  ORF Transcript_47710/g.54944 Transcript_47710/m.54944 type:complete len:182 (-) Transcript_47710:1352-1897(-)
MKIRAEKRSNPFDDDARFDTSERRTVCSTDMSPFESTFKTMMEARENLTHQVLQNQTEGDFLAQYNRTNGHQVNQTFLSNHKISTFFTPVSSTSHSHDGLHPNTTMMMDHNSNHQTINFNQKCVICNQPPLEQLVCHNCSKVTCRNCLKMCQSCESYNCSVCIVPIYEEIETRELCASCVN